MKIDPRTLCGPAVGISPTERRQHARYPFTAAVVAVDTRSRSHLTARTSDIGHGGCYVDVFCPFPVNAPVRIRLTSEKKSFIADAVVTNSKIGMGMGLKFTEVSKEYATVLEKWLGELSGEAPCELEDAAEEKVVALQVASAAPKEKVPRRQWHVLNELILRLMRRGVLSQTEGQAMLHLLVEQDVEAEASISSAGAGAD